LYRAAWEPALWFVRVLAALEKVAGGPSTRFGRLSAVPLRGRPGWRLANRLGTDLSNANRSDSTGARPTVWLHAASLGECKGLWAFAQTLRAPDTRILLTANTTAGLDFLRAQISREASPGNFTARIAPLDHPRLAQKFLRTFNVRALVLFEVELWPHWIQAASQNKGADVPVLWISARLTKVARRRYAGSPLFAAALRRVLRGIAWTQAQTDEDARALRDLGCLDVEAGGDLRGLHYLFGSRLAPDSERPGIAFVSIHAQELPAIVPGISAVGTESPLIVFPRKMHELPEFVKALAPFGFALDSERPDADRRIVDSLGCVPEMLGTVRIAVIGGSFVPRGGHNLWEPLLAGCRIVIGPHHGNQEYLARKLAAAGLLRVAANANGLVRELKAAAETDENLPVQRAEFIDGERALLLRAALRARARVGSALFPG
jgi:3-deoxy-D-manno-octulosonic-acid transferase